MLQRYSGHKQFTLEGGEKLPTKTAGFSYQFEFGEEANIFEGAMVELLIEGRRVAGNLTGILQGRIIVTLQEERGKIIASSILRINNTALLQALHDRLEKIERGEVSPSAGILVRLATAFDLTLAGLLLRAEETGRLFRAEAQPQWRDPRTGYVRRQIFRASDHPVEVVQVEMPAGKKASFPASSYVNMRHVVWVESGELVLIQGGDRNLLKAGDSLGFGPPSDVTYANEGKKPCRYIVTLART